MNIFSYKVLYDLYKDNELILYDVEFNECIEKIRKIESSEDYEILTLHDKYYDILVKLENKEKL